MREIVIDNLPKLKKPEDKDLKSFAKFLASKIDGEAVTIIDKPDQTGTGRFDYLLSVGNKTLAIEITQILEREKEVIRSVQWGNAVGALRKEIRKLLTQHKKYKSLSGLWLVETPESFGVTRRTSKDFAYKSAPQILDAIILRQSSVRIGNFPLKLENVSKEGAGVYFASHSRARFVDSAGDVVSRIEQKLEEKNAQLDTRKGKRILLLINKNMLASVRDYVEALGRIDGLWELNNIDEI